MIGDGDDLRMRRTAIFGLKQEANHFKAVFIESDPIYKKLYGTTTQETVEVWTTLKRAATEFVDTGLSDAQDMSLLELISSTFSRC